jgi:hypothetical protein
MALPPLPLSLPPSLSRALSTSLSLLLHPNLSLSFPPSLSPSFFLLIQLFIIIARALSLCLLVQWCIIVDLCRRSLYCCFVPLRLREREIERARARAREERARGGREGEVLLTINK